MAEGERGANLSRWAVISLGVAVFAVRAKRAQEVYAEEVSSGSRPIEGVATSIAAFMGLPIAGINGIGDDRRHLDSSRRRFWQKR